MNPKRSTEEDIMGDFGFRLIWSVLDHWADVTVFEISGRSDTWQPLFVVEESDWAEQLPSVDGAEKYLEGFVKWDGCSEFDFHGVHFCGPEGYKRHFELLKYIYTRAYQLMGREPEQPWTE